MKKSSLIFLVIPLILAACQKSREIAPISQEVQNTGTSAVVATQHAPAVEKAQTNASSSWSEVKADGKILDTGMTEKEILVKIAESTQGLQTNEKSGTWILVQGDFRAEYESSPNNTSDKIRILKNWLEKTYELSYNKKNLGLIGCEEKKEKDGFACSDRLSFGYFQDFSPSGNYLFYTIRAWENSYSEVLDVSNGKVAMTTKSAISCLMWTKDRKQLLYWFWSDMGWDQGIYLTKSGSFPDSMKIGDIYPDACMIDGSYIYATHGVNFGRGELKIYDLKTLKEVYSKEIK